MKKINSKGFTLIELLAVITIMGILMLVAIPAVSRTIENSRRDSFADVAKTYINTVRNAVIADELKCGTGDVSVAATGKGRYYFAIDTTQDGTKDLMESGGKSSWGSNNLIGMVLWLKLPADNGGFKTTYEVLLVDAQNHGIPVLTPEESVSRSSVKVNTKNETPSVQYSTLGAWVAAYDDMATPCTLK